jgi:Uma2 family endonuclease
MSVALNKRMSLAEFLAWEERQQARFEFDGFQPVAMTGGTVAHNRIMRRLHRVLEQRLDGTPCEPFGPDVKIVADGRARYPDAVISCTSQSDRAQIIENPVIVFEVLSDSTSRTERIEKVREYGATPSILRYVILEQDSIGATLLIRNGNQWAATTLSEDDVLDLPEVGIAVRLDEIYPRSRMAEQASPLAG